MAQTPKKRDDEPKQGTDKKLDELYKLVDGMQTAMLTTRRPDGDLVSRAMANQARATGADFWFVAEDGSDKVTEIEAEPHVNLAYFRDGTREWVSVAGRAQIVRDRAKIRELYRPDWRAWFGDEGGEKNGGPDDPRLVLIAVDARSVHYYQVDKPKPLVLFELVKGMVTGTPPNVGEERSLRGDEAHRPP